MYRFGSQQRTGLPAKFERFRQNIELTENQTQGIITSHTALRRQLQQLDYVSDSFLTGSYKKNTRYLYNRRFDGSGFCILL